MDICRIIVQQQQQERRKNKGEEKTKWYSKLESILDTALTWSLA